MLTHVTLTAVHEEVRLLPRSAGEGLGFPRPQSLSAAGLRFEIRHSGSVAYMPVLDILPLEKQNKTGAFLSTPTLCTCLSVPGLPYVGNGPAEGL